MAIKRQVFEKLKGFNEKLLYSEDIDFWIRACKEGFKSLAGVTEMKVIHNNRKDLNSIICQYFNYTKSFAFILKEHFKKRFFITFRDVKFFEIKGITGVFEINPHTLSIPLAIFMALLFPIKWLLTIPLLIMLNRFYFVWKFLKNYNEKFYKIIIFAFIIEMKQIAVTSGALAGAIKEKIIFIK